MCNKKSKSKKLEGWGRLRNIRGVAMLFDHPRRRPRDFNRKKIMMVTLREDEADIKFRDGHAVHRSTTSIIVILITSEFAVS
jgi:hypothetical protein